HSEQSIMAESPNDASKRAGTSASQQQQSRPQQAEARRPEAAEAVAGQVQDGPTPAGAAAQGAAPKADARTAGNSRDLAREDTVIGPVSPTRAGAIRLGREAAARSGAPKLPTAAELDRIRDEYFGGR